LPTFNAVLRLKATWISLRVFATRYLLFSAASSIALVSIVLAGHIALLNQQYTGGLLKVPVDYGLVKLGNMSIPFYVTNAAYASLYGISVRGNECIVLGELPQPVVGELTEVLGCSSLVTYPAYGYLMVVKLGELGNGSNGTLIIPKDPVSYFSTVLMGNVSGFTSLMYVVFLTIVGLSSTYLSLSHLGYLTEAFRRLRFITGGGLVEAVSHLTVLVVSSYLLVATFEDLALGLLLSRQSLVRFSYGAPPLMVIGQLITLITPMLIVVVVSWRLSSR
jgi:hypothetical protein